MAETLTLPARMDLSAATDLLSELKTKNLSGEVTLDAVDVTHFGSLCVQIVMSAARSCHAAGGTLSFANVSDAVEAQLDCMGLTSEALAGGCQ